jgi:hypothetical protein
MIDDILANMNKLVWKNNNNFNCISLYFIIFFCCNKFINKLINLY